MTTRTAKYASFSVITPSFNMLPYLQRCASSVSDQGVDVEHIVIDGGSRDGTPQWLGSRPDIVSVVERDRGMYDAVNKGLRRAGGEFVSYLNCDEQYLPGALNAVAAYFRSNPDVDIVFGHALIVNPDCRLLSYRKGYPPRWWYILSSHLYVLSCTMFMRRRVIDEGMEFDTAWRDVGDAEFVVRALRCGYRAAVMRRYLAAFTMTGANMSAGSNAKSEAARLRRSAPRWARALRLPLDALRRVEKAASGAHRERFPLSYELYVNSSASRARLTAATGTFRWPRP
jgi:glycosyltransferase involved in cell wall biosynthesis